MIGAPRPSSDPRIAEHGGAVLGHRGQHPEYVAPLRRDPALWAAFAEDRRTHPYVAPGLIDIGGTLVHPQAPHGTREGATHYGCRCDHCASVVAA